MAFLSKEIRFLSLRWPFPALCLRQSSSLRLSRHIPSSHLNWRKVLHKTGFAALPAPDFKWRCFPVQVWDQIFLKRKVEMEMEKIKWNWNLKKESRMAIYSLSTSDLLLLLLFAYCYHDAIFLLSFLSSDFLLLEVTETQPYFHLLNSKARQFIIEELRVGATYINFHSSTRKTQQTQG